ncbi:4Fe-4S binding protein [Deinococcus yavapaiensis]|uniref:4Fe-4S dicluster protein n=1 Tax=Deinococcus yavapaiensis KR-236 TaxID=694435 RepID=A0A318S5H3_9DEIO|nr:4Fe-4S binding protein [Deinococcus yavapaiensis]PYE52855.1 4Fe-4S dicluster protein [Deinococcus yavapaiensis KR-236]
MFDSFLKIMGDYGNPVPRYTGPRCLVERMSVGGCDVCATVCPHDAITVDGKVEIDERKCTSCGLCVQSCPTGALEFDVTANLTAIRTQEEDAKLVCSRTSEGGKTVPCLARVTASVIVAAGAWDKPLELVHGDCATCDLGSDLVPVKLAEVVDAAQSLREATGRLANVTIRRGVEGGAENRGERVTRRGMFGTLLRSAAGVAKDLVPDKPLPFVDWSAPEERVPADWLWRRRALKPTPAQDVQVRWKAPLVDASCIFCPVCSNVCPTEAITRTIEADGSVALHLQLEACTGCGGCASSCPPQAIELSDDWREEHFAAPVLLRASDGPP